MSSVMKGLAADQMAQRLPSRITIPLFRCDEVLSEDELMDDVEDVVAQVDDDPMGDENLAEPRPSEAELPLPPPPPPPPPPAPPVPVAERPPPEVIDIVDDTDEEEVQFDPWTYDMTLTLQRPRPTNGERSIIQEVVAVHNPPVQDDDDEKYWRACVLWNTTAMRNLEDHENEKNLLFSKLAIGRLLTTTAYASNHHLDWRKPFLLLDVLTPPPEPDILSEGDSLVLHVIEKATEKNCTVPIFERLWRLVVSDPFLVLGREMIRTLPTTLMIWGARVQEDEDCIIGQEPRGNIFLDFYTEDVVTVLIFHAETITPSRIRHIQGSFRTSELKDFYCKCRYHLQSHQQTGTFAVHLSNTRPDFKTDPELNKMFGTISVETDPETGSESSENPDVVVPVVVEQVQQSPEKSPRSGKSQPNGRPVGKTDGFFESSQNTNDALMDSEDRENVDEDDLISCKRRFDDDPAAVEELAARAAHFAAGKSQDPDQPTCSKYLKPLTEAEKQFLLTQQVLLSSSESGNNGGANNRNSQAQQSSSGNNPPPPAPPVDVVTVDDDDQRQMEKENEENPSQYQFTQIIDELR